MKLSKLLLFLECPLCRSSLINKNDKLVCGQCKTSFSIIGGVPVLLENSALNEQEIKQKRWFNQHYSTFSKEEYKLENWRLSMLERIFSAVPGKRIEKYLDIGCGATGYTVIESAKKNDWLSFGIDISLEAMIRAKNLAEKEGVEGKTAFVVCSAEKLPFKKNCFDFISAISLLEHLEEDNTTISAIAEILKEKGVAYFCVPNTYKRMWLFLWPIYFYFDRQIGHKRHYAIESLNRLTKDNGFKLQKHFYNAHLAKLFALILNRLGLISEDKWWEIERNDFNLDSSGIQLNAVFEKVINQN